MTQEEYRESLMKNKTLDELEEEYQLSLSYLEELKNVYNKDGSLDKTNKREALVIIVWKDLIEKAVNACGDRKKVYKIVSRDFQRFFTNYLRYADILQSMWETNDKKTKEKYSELIRILSTKILITSLNLENGLKHLEIKNLQERLTHI